MYILLTIETFFNFPRAYVKRDIVGALPNILLFDMYIWASRHDVSVYICT